LARKFACRSDDARIAVAPIMTIAGVGASSATLDCEHGPIAVMLYLMNPFSAFGRLVSQAGKLGWDKAKVGHSCFFIRTSANCESGSDGTLRYKNEKPGK